MTVRELTQRASLKTVVMPNPEKEVTGVYIGDLLSWVMGRASSGDAWLTIMSNLNILAVATLADTSCIILAEGVEIDEDVKNTANDKGINILSCEKGMYEIAVELSKVI